MRARKTPTGRASKGSVYVLSFQNRLRLQFRGNGKQRVISLGLDDTPDNRKKAGLTASQIEVDLGSGNFDNALAKNKPQKKNQQTLKSNITIT